MYLATEEDLNTLYEARKVGAGEEDFLMQFLQLSQEEIPPNPDNRQFVFDSFDSNHNHNLNFADVI